MNSLGPSINSAIASTHGCSCCKGDELPWSIHQLCNCRCHGWRLWLLFWCQPHQGQWTHHHFPGVSDQRAGHLCPVLRQLQGGEQPIQVELLQLLLLQGEQLLQLHHRGHRPHRICFWKQR